MEKLNRIIINDLSASGKCNLFHYGNVIEGISHFSHEFIGGKIYGIIGEFGYGGAALTNCLVGKIPMYEGNINFNGNNESQIQIAEKSCYVGDNVFRKGILKKQMTVKEQIEYGLKNTKSNSYDVNEIQKLFNLSNERFNRKIKYVSGERWKASAAIGYAAGRSIYCYPWMNTKDIEHLNEQISMTIPILINVGATIIIPTTKEENMHKLCLDCEIIFL